MDPDVFKKMNDQGEGSHGIDNDFAAQSMDNVGAWILGRNMFGPFRGPWKDKSWKGWWGDNPPYHCAGIGSHASRARAPYDGRRHDLLLCHRWRRVGLKERRKQRPKAKMFGLVTALPRFVST